MKSRKKPLIRFRRPEVGALPGSLAVEAKAPKPSISLMRYSAAERDVFKDVAVEDIPRYLDPKSMLWIDIQGLGDERILNAVARQFNISGLALADIVHVPQRPKAEFLGEDLLIVTKMVHLTDEYNLDSEQVSIYLSGNTVLTFQERPGDVFDPIRRRLKDFEGPLRNGSAAYLVYSLLDTIVDVYFPTLEAMGDYIQQLEHFALTRPNQSILGRTSDVKNQLLNLRRAIWPQRETLKVLLDDESGTFNEHSRRHLRDTQDHAIQASEINEMYREMASNLMHLSMSVISNRTNDQMKVLTVMASVFIPLTFIVGVYGMNFDHMPELHYRWAYPAVWLTMIATAAGSLIYFFRKGWIIDRRANDDPFEVTDRHLPSTSVGAKKP